MQKKILVLGIIISMIFVGCATSESDEALTEEIETASDAKDSKDEVLAEGAASEEKSVESDSEEVKTDEESIDKSEKDITKDKLKKENS